MFTRLDRLARSTRDLPNTLDAIAGKGARFGLFSNTLG
jgi:DNA invertase Pin-like site-specific DNA recombinase